MAMLNAPFATACRLASESIDAFEGAMRAGLLDPALVFASAKGVLQWGSSPAALFAASAYRFPNRNALIDEAGAITYAELDRRTDAIAAGLQIRLNDRSVHAARPPVLGLLCRNHRGFALGHLAAIKLGADVVLLNTGSAAPQLRDVLECEGVTILAYDEDVAAIALAAGADALHVRLDGGPTGSESLASLEALAQSRTVRNHVELTPPKRVPQTVLLTSGTTGTPKGARRAKQPRDPRLAAGLLAAIPYRVGDVIVVAAPLFHAWGFAQYLLSAALGCTIILRRNFDAEETLALVEEHRANGLAVVPVMLQRLLSLPAGIIDTYAHESLRVVASSGSALPGQLASRWMEVFGEHLYNFYGSTEVGLATVATPTDLHAAPSTAGRALGGIDVAILDDKNRPLPAGGVGRIFVGNAAQFDGYTGGGRKDTVGRLMATGDRGYLDRQGRLYVGGREDDMIVSGGENVFPREVEDLLLSHRAVADVAVVGIADDEFGERLAAFVVIATGETVTAEDLQTFVRNRLARHKVPRDIVFVAELPRNATGKLLRSALANSENGR